MKRAHDNRGISLIELIIVIAIMGVLIGVISPMFMKYVVKSRKAKDVYTTDEIARAVNVAFIENQDAYDKFMNIGYGAGKKTLTSATVDATVNGVTRRYDVWLVASNGKQDTNKVSNCFNGGESYFFKTKKDGSDGFYGTINRELGLSTTEMND